MNTFDLYSFSFRDIWMLGTVFCCLFFLLDDLFIDFISIIKNKKSHQITKNELFQMNNLPEKRIAILIANWHEAEIIERIVTGNIQNINYKNYEIILGVYPNDKETLQAARNVEKKSKNVTVVVNVLPGPTSKGQMINQMVRYLKSYNQIKENTPFDMILIHDSEDLIHKSSLKLLNFRAENYDFIQIPVFSLEIPLTKLTAGIYIDEFVESHTKELLVRDHFHAGLPSAGVGTALNWKVVQKILDFQGGSFLNENTLTEDYHLGLSCHQLGIKQHFSCEYIEYDDKVTKNRKIDYIATREYFPQKVYQSIRQKTRWSLGIILQGIEEMNWKTSSFYESYFLWRDRKALINAPLFILAFIFTNYYMYSMLINGSWPSLDNKQFNKLLEVMMIGNLIFSVLRILSRMVLVNKIYGLKIASFVPIRWVLSNFINTASIYNAVYKWTRSKIKGELLVWSKTDHIIPIGFGLENASLIENQNIDANTQFENSNKNEIEA